MNPGIDRERDLLVQQLGACEERARQLERTVTEQQRQWELAARSWRRLQIHHKDLAEWLVDIATDESQRIIHQIIDAALSGELFVPCSFTASVNGRHYRINLVSTRYEICEITGHG